MSKPLAYYNEHDPRMAAWLRELIRRNLIMQGDVDERDIQDVIPAELSRYRQCHFFAGIGAWSYALRKAGWPDDRPVWTGSCPCQPFSAAGKRTGVNDGRNMWPSWFHLIRQRSPSVVLGEQVASSHAKVWLDIVHTDMEAMDYAFGAMVLPAASVGAPQPRHRIFFVAESGGERREGERLCLQPGESRSPGVEVAGGCSTGGMGNPDGSGLEGRPGEPRDDGSQLPAAERTDGEPGIMANADSDGGWRDGPGTIEGTACGVQGADGKRERFRPDIGPGRTAVSGESCPGPTNGFWRDADWLRCRDERWRPVEPGSFPLVARSAGSVVRGGDRGEPIAFPTAEARRMRLHGYGNSIVAPVAEAFIRAFLESEHEALS